MEKIIDEILQENFHKFVSPTLLTIADQLVHPYNLEKIDLIYREDTRQWFLIVQGKSPYGLVTNAKEIK